MRAAVRTCVAAGGNEAGAEHPLANPRSKALLEGLNRFKLSHRWCFKKFEMQSESSESGLCPPLAFRVRSSPWELSASCH